MNNKSDIEISDIVRLSSGGPSATVNKFVKINEKIYADCIYCRDSGFNHFTVNVLCLVKIEQEGSKLSEKDLESGYFDE